MHLSSCLTLMMERFAFESFQNPVIAAICLRLSGKLHQQLTATYDDQPDVRLGKSALR